MRRIVLAAVAAIAALTGGSVLVILLFAGDPAPAREHATPPGPLLPAAEAAPPAPERLARAAPPPGARSQRTAAPRGDAPPPASRVLRKAVRRSLLAGAIDGRLSACAASAVGFGAAGRAPAARPAILVLDLETLDGEVRIADAGVERWNEASPAAVACARDVLRGQVIAAPGARAGQRLRMPYPLTARPPPVDAAGAAAATAGRAG